MTIIITLLLAFSFFICIQYGASNDIPKDINPWNGESKSINFEEEEERLLLEKGRNYGKQSGIK